MARFVKGDIIVIPFPFSDLSGSKKRPAFVPADLSGDDIILCQITSQFKKDEYSIQLTSSDLESGSSVKLSYIRPNHIFTADKNIIIKKVASVKEDIHQQVVDTLIDIINP